MLDRQSSSKKLLLLMAINAYLNLLISKKIPFFSEVISKHNWKEVSISKVPHFYQY